MKVLKVNSVNDFLDIENHSDFIIFTYKEVLDEIMPLFDGELSFPENLYIIRQNLDFESTNLLINLTLSNEFNQLDVIDFSDSKSYTFHDSWLKIIDSLNNLSLSNTDKTISNLISNYPPILSKTTYVMDFINSFINKVALPSINKWPFGSIDINHRNFPWYRSNNIVLESIVKFKKTFLNKTKLSSLNSLDLLNRKINSLINFWDKYEKYSTPEKYYYLSCYTLFLSDVYFCNNNILLAHILLHRSTELFMTFVCFENNLINSNHSSLILVNGESLGFSNILEIININLKYLDNNYEHLKKMNNVRNNLIAVHSAFQIYKDDYIFYRNIFNNICKTYSQDDKFLFYYNLFDLRNLFKHSLIFEVEDNLDTYIHKIIK